MNNNVSVLLQYLLPEHGSVAKKISTLKKVIHLILQGEKYPGLLMTIIRFLLPNSDHTLKKLLLIFWEIVPKTTSDGKLLQEMILVCDAYRKVCLLLLLCLVTNRTYNIQMNLLEVQHCVSCAN